jgi:hypothetical protein
MARKYSAKRRVIKKRKNNKYIPKGSKTIKKRRILRGGDSNSKSKDDNNDIGFIILRCVRNKQQNILYKDSYEAVRKYYPDVKIVIIDDNSDKTVLDEYHMTNVEVINSEYPGAGEYLPYWYLLNRKMFKKAIFLQDSMILNSKIPYEEVNDYMFLYEVPNSVDRNNKYIYEFLDTTKVPNELKSRVESGNWRGCWGSMMIITLEFLEKLESVTGISKWIEQINNRTMRIALECAIGIACMHVNSNKERFSAFGKFTDMAIMKDPGNEKYTLDMYLQDKTRIKDSIIKVWNKR